MSIRAALVMITVLGAAGGAAAGGYTYFSGASERQRQQERANRERDIRIGLSRHLERSQNPALRSVVAGHETAPDLWAFRASVAESEEKHSPAFGHAMLHCDSEFDRGACWTVAELFVDGVMRHRLNEKELDVLRKSKKVSTVPFTTPAPEPQPVVVKPAQEDAQSEKAQEESGLLDATFNAIGSAADAMRTALIGEAKGAADAQSASAATAEPSGDANAVEEPVPANDASAEEPPVENTSAGEGLSEDGSSEEAANAAEAPSLASPSSEELTGGVDGAATQETPEDAVADAASASTEKDGSAPFTPQEAETAAAGADVAALDASEKSRSGADLNGTPVPVLAPSPRQGSDAQSAEKEEVSQTEETAEEEAAPQEPTAEEAAAAEPQAIEAKEAVSEDPASNAPASETAESEIPAQEAPVATHTVRVSEVNARLSPSMKGRVLAVLSAGQQLQLISNKRGWGRYLILNGDNEGEKVWIFKRLVREAR